MSAAELARALGGHRSGGRSFMVRCPVHEDRLPSLSITDGRSGTVLLHCFAGCSPHDIIRVLQDLELWPKREDRDDKEERRRGSTAAAARLDDEARASAKVVRDLLRAKDVIRESFAPTPATTVGRYLIARGIDPPWPACIRQHPRLYHCDELGRVSHRPAMVCAIHDIHTDEIIGLHRTYLVKGGYKADVTVVKKVLGRMKGGAVKLTPDEDVTDGIGISEGVETGLSILAAGWSPIWALLSAGNLAAFPLLNGLEVLTIFGDNDDHKIGLGEKAACECASRWSAAGREVTTYIPKAAGVDWNDELGHR